jgi:type I restriction enzyme S subunit
VAKIEELFSDLDAGVEALKKAKAEIKRYRQAVLKFAFEGRLTEEWRSQVAKSQEPIETAEELLERIRKERIAKSQEAGAKRRTPKESEPLDTSELPRLPEGWAYLTLEPLCADGGHSIKRGPFGSAIKKAFFVPTGFKVFEQGNVIRDDFHAGDYFINQAKFDELRDFAVEPGDVLITCAGTIGRIAVAPQAAPKGIINQALLKLRLESNIVSTRYFVYLFRHKVDEILRANTRGSAMLNIASVKDLKMIPFPTPPQEEQQQIVSEIERRFSVADEAEKVIDRSLKQAETLRQSILKRAFEGRLVPQKPEDEPAEKLLERIRLEKAKRIVHGGTRVRRGKRRGE